MTLNGLELATLINTEIRQLPELMHFQKAEYFWSHESVQSKTAGEVFWGPQASPAF